jgi:hypothetical protein
MLHTVELLFTGPRIKIVGSNSCRNAHIVVVICAMICAAWDRNKVSILYLLLFVFFFVTFMNFVRNVCFDPGWIECRHNTNNIQEVN